MYNSLTLGKLLKTFIMNNLRNHVQLMGRLGQDPEIINLDSGKKLAKFSLATNDYYTTAKGEKVENTDWHNVVAWGKTAEVIENHVTKGQEVLVGGKLTTRSYETKEGNKRYITEVVCSNLVMTQKWFLNPQISQFLLGFP